MDSLFLSPPFANLWENLLAFQGDLSNYRQDTALVADATNLQIITDNRTQDQIDIRQNVFAQIRVGQKPYGILVYEACINTYRASLDYYLKLHALSLTFFAGYVAFNNFYNAVERRQTSDNLLATFRDTLTPITDEIGKLKDYLQTLSGVVKDNHAVYDGLYNALTDSWLKQWASETSRDFATMKAAVDLDQIKQVRDMDCNTAMNDVTEMGDICAMLPNKVKETIENVSDAGGGLDRAVLTTDWNSWQQLANKTPTP